MQSEAHYCVPAERVMTIEFSTEFGDNFLYDIRSPANNSEGLSYKIAFPGGREQKIGTWNCFAHPYFYQEFPMSNNQNVSVEFAATSYEYTVKVRCRSLGKGEPAYEDSDNNAQYSVSKGTYDFNFVAPIHK